MVELTPEIPQSDPGFLGKGAIWLFEHFGDSIQQVTVPSNVLIERATLNVGSSSMQGVNEALQTYHNVSK